MFCRWKSTVLTDRNSDAAASRLVAPSGDGEGHPVLGRGELRRDGIGAGSGRCRRPGARPGRPNRGPRSGRSRRGPARRACGRRRGVRRARDSAWASFVSAASTGKPARSAASRSARGVEVVVGADGGAGPFGAGRRDRPLVGRRRERGQHRVRLRSGGRPPRAARPGRVRRRGAGSGRLRRARGSWCGRRRRPVRSVRGPRARSRPGRARRDRGRTRVDAVESFAGVVIAAEELLDVGQGDFERGALEWRALGNEPDLQRKPVVRADDVAPVTRRRGTRRPWPRRGGGRPARGRVRDRRRTARTAASGARRVAASTSPTVHRRAGPRHPPGASASSARRRAGSETAGSSTRAAATSTAADAPAVSKRRSASSARAIPSPDRAAPPDRTRSRAAAGPRDQRSTATIPTRRSGSSERDGAGEDAVRGFGVEGVEPGLGGGEDRGPDAGPRRAQRGRALVDPRRRRRPPPRRVRSPATSSSASAAVSSSPSAAAASCQARRGGVLGRGERARRARDGRPGGSTRPPGGTRPRAAVAA